MSWHFWIATIGIVVYITSMWVSGILQGLMWRAYTNLGFLEYSFIETVEAMHPFYVIRAIGGALFLIGALIMAYNVWRTIYPRDSWRPSRAWRRPNRRIAHVASSPSGANIRSSNATRFCFCSGF